MQTLTNLSLAAIAAGLFLVAHELRQIRFGKVDIDLADRWWRAVARYAPSLQEQTEAPIRKDY